MTQPDLFDGMSQKAMHIALDASWQLTHYSGFFSAIDCEALFELCHWEQPRIQLFGKSHLIPRLQAFYGEEGLSYQYSGKRFFARPFLPTIESIKDRIEALLAVRYNVVLVNCYRDGQDGMGFHSDDEPEINQQIPIASVSLGGSRHFRLKSKVDKTKSLTLLLQHGDLLIMPPGLQDYWVHALPKTRKFVDKRINLTFRQIMPNAL